MRKYKGFTLIEVVLVLAIAGLIFMMVFITLPTVWANQRDAARRDDMMSFVQQLKKYQSNNSRGALPNGTGEVNGEDVNKDRTTNFNKVFAETSWGGFFRDYFEESFMDPIGEPYNLRVGYCSANVSGVNNSIQDKLGIVDDECDSDYGKAINEPPKYPNDQKIYVLIGAKCNGEKAVGSANIRKVAVLYKLEGGGVYCGES